MYKIHSSNRLENLCQVLADSIREPGHDIFGKEVIITQSAGMNSWLKTGLARINGVFANFEFPAQEGLIAGLYQLLFDKPLRNDTDEITYKIYGLLGCDGFKSEFADVAGYYKDSDLRRFQLASRIAGLFGQYQLYSDEMIAGWEQNRLATENPAEEWERWLWLRLETESRRKTMNRMYEQMEARQDAIRERYPVISLFGITAYTRFHLDFFTELSKYTKVTFYLCLPAAGTLHRNGLLAVFGTQASELAEMFRIDGFKPVLNESDTLLSRLQNQVLGNSGDPEFRDDGSLRVNSCYTPVREAECLYNYLLDLFDKDRTLKPGDVLVMATDIGKYAPFIKAVFRNAPVRIPFLVSGAANNSEDSMTAVLEMILNFSEEDLTSEKVVSLLEQKRIRQRFGIQDYNYIRTMVGKANIRFGRENSADDDTQYVSWKYGLEKIVLGYAMLTDEEFDRKYPFRDAEGAAGYDLLRLKSFVEILESVIDAHDLSKTLAEWKTFLFEEVVEKMIWCDDSSKDDRAELSSVFRALLFTGSLDFQEPVPFRVFLEELNTKLFKGSQEIKLNTGNVTVSSPAEVRAIPFRVICFLGLNSDAFPRKDSIMGFDLLGEEGLRGVRNKKETDKGLFLDTLLAAREKLYLSYIGQSVKDNTEIPPSIVVDTLLDYPGSEELVVKHPLHGFSSRYREDDERLFTYLYSQKPSVPPAGIKVEKEIREVSVGSLVRFFVAPVDWYFNNILDIRYDENEEELSETELFELDNLQLWKVKNDLIKLKESEITSYINKGIKEGFLPLKSAAIATVEGIVKEVADISQAYQKLVGKREEKKIVIDTEIDGIRIKGIIDSVYDRDFLAFSVSRHLLKHKVEAYIKGLLLAVEDGIDAATFLNIEGIVSAVPVNKESARADLETLIEFYRAGNITPLLFTLKAGEKATDIAVKAANEADKIAANADVKKPGNRTDGAEKEVKPECEEILKAFKADAFPYEGSDYPANPYLQILIRENRFENFGDQEIQLIRDIADKLKINQF
ncbi:MAG: exodeoxyribonuclease V subunit gamma [Bacteroidota bacterium]